MKPLLFAALLLCAPAVATAQQVPRPPRPDTSGAALRVALRGAQGANLIVRLWPVAGAPLTGRVGEVADSTARVATKQVSLDQQSRLEVRFGRPDPLWEGTIIGGGVGLYLGYLGAAFASSMSERPTRRRVVFVEIATVGAVGALFGAVIDNAFEDHEWRLVWLRQH